MRRVAFALALLISAVATAQSPFQGPNPWPAIRKERIATLLPGAMSRASVDAWVVMLRENANDPLALHVGGENAGAPAAAVFLRSGDRVRSVMLSGFGEAIALRELGLHDSVVVYPGTLEDAIAERLRGARPTRIAINSGGALGVADGLSYAQRARLEAALGPEYAPRLVPAAAMVTDWLSVKLPSEVEIMRRAARLTAQLEFEAYATVVAGRSRGTDIARFLKRRMRELGVEDG
ncbi:MAG: hypothetical protein K2X99_04790, partial [Gemmatimonadaceae bacterium]|nr:hypothetical protein [Gemmatimonadaceae bacterium]